MRPLIIIGIHLALQCGQTISAVDPEIFLDKYCLNCHDRDLQKGDRDFESLSFPIDGLPSIIKAQDIIDQLVLGEMPPQKAKAQPSEEEVTNLIAALTQQVGQARDSLESTGAQTVLRRLNRREYTNTIEDLLGLDLESFDPTRNFPTDQTAEHMDNIGDTLVTSGYLLDQYLEAADAVIEKVFSNLEKPKEENWRFRGNFYQGSELAYSHKRVFNYRYLCIYEVTDTPRQEGCYGYVNEFKTGVPADGLYEIQLLAHAKNRDHPYDDKIFGTDFAEPFRLGIVPGRDDAGLLHNSQPIEPLLDEVTVGDGEPKWHTMKVWLHEGQTPRFTFINGMESSRSAFSAIANRYKDHWPKGDFEGGIVDARRVVLEHGKMPHIRIHEVKIRGPIFNTWPPRKHQIILGDKPFRPERTREILKRFADRAYRRPATKEEIDNLMNVVKIRRAEGHSPMQAMKDALKAALCSPAFIYLAEPGRQQSKGEKLGAHDLASRLSYFLWSTMPDPELRALADSGEILKPAVLHQQMHRLLKDPRSEEFVAGFLDAWLNLRSLGDMPPDRDMFADYYTWSLESAFAEETRAFTRHLLENNRPIFDYLDSDYTVLNKSLAKHYELDTLLKEFDREPAKAHHFRKVSLANYPNRGGLIGMGSVLTVTANGIETSPVTRGVWILENIFGTPPAPPPDDVPPIDPDIRGATTIRDQLEKHREVTTCNECHRKIDPPGFALENFDPVGAWRTHYPAGRKQGPKIDASDQLSSGQAFSSIPEFKELLLNRKEPFARMLTERLLTYATGRRMEVLDRGDVDKIVKQLGQRGNGMQDLLELVTTSSLFQSP
ncbi:MAG: DUF1592 domain-containing protein [Verrucomicrobiota bacterium]